MQSNDPGIVITVEPELDKSPAPYDIKPLVDLVDAVDAGVFQDLGRTDAPPLPNGTATLS